MNAGTKRSMHGQVDGPFVFLDRVEDAAENPALYSRDHPGRPAYVILSIAAWDALGDKLEDLSDRLALAREGSAGAMGGAVPHDVVTAEAAGVHPIRAWRAHLKLTQDELAGRAGVAKSYLQEVESGKKPGSVAFYRKVADTLDLALDDVVPTVLHDDIP